MDIQESQLNLAIVSELLPERIEPSLVQPHHFANLQLFLAQAEKLDFVNIDCLLIDLAPNIAEHLDILASIARKCPLVALVDELKPLPQYLTQNTIFNEVLSHREWATPLGIHRIKQTIQGHQQPLNFDILTHPLIGTFQVILDHVSDWVLVKDLQHRFLFVTSSFAANTGLAMNEIIGKNDLEIGNSEEDVYGNPDTGWRGFWTQDDEVTSSGIASVEDNPDWCMFSETPRHKRTLRIPLKNAAGKICALLVCAKDITEQKQNERMLRDRTEMLAQVTQEKQNAEKHRQIAEQAVTTKNKFLAAASHDLRQPLHAMGLFLDVLESRMSVQDDLELMKKLKQSTVSLNNLFNSLLDISRLDAGVVEPQEDHIPASRLFDNLCEDFRHQAAEKKLQFVGQSEDVVLLSDFLLLSRIVRNLVVNAIDNTQSGSVELHCRTGDDEAHIILITDTGSGIPEEEHARIFEEFHQITNEHDQAGKGIGLGLAIVRRLCDLLSIEISIESKLEQGTCFALRVPIGEPSKVIWERQQHNSLSLQGLTILVLDDDKNICEGMEALLQVYGCSTYSAGSLDEIFDKLSQSAPEPDLIMADYELGLDITGDKMVDALRNELGRCVPAVLITGDTSIASEHNATIGDLPKPQHLSIALRRFKPMPDHAR